MQTEFKLYKVDMKYIRNLHHIDDRVLSVSPQTGKDTRVFVGIVIVCGTHKYCIPLSSPKDKHKRMRNSMDFSKIEVDGKLLGVLNFNLMIPIEEAQLQPIDLIVRRRDRSEIIRYKELCQKELEWCHRHSEVICNKANVLYKAYISDDTFSARDRCLDFHKMEAECKKFNTKAPEEAIRKGMKMAVYTRNEIKTAFVLLLDERPFTKITVKDVVLKCGVNRNTFYYYFRDLPDLAEAVVEEDYGQVTEGSLDIHTLGECLDACIRFALEHRNAVMHLYRSTNRERFILSTRRVCDRITEQYLNTILDGHHITQEDRKYLHTYYRSILLGWMLDWLEDDMKSDIRKLSGRISQLKQGHMEDIIRRCEIK